MNNVGCSCTFFCIFNINILTLKSIAASFKIESILQDLFDVIKSTGLIKIKPQMIF
jgi:hypothetical protein